MKHVKAIGIDPGKDTGIAIYDSKAKTFDAVYSSDFWGVIQAIDELIYSSFTDEYELVAVVEVPNNKSVWHSGASSRGAINRTAVNVGSVIREAELIAEYIERRSIRLIKQHPKGKVDADYFKRVTGWDKRTNSHSRDAGMLCFGVK